METTLTFIVGKEFAKKSQPAHLIYLVMRENSGKAAMPPMESPLGL